MPDRADTDQQPDGEGFEVRLSDDEWLEKLSPEEFHVCRAGQTEPAFSGEYAGSTEPGVFACVCCEAELFDSETKFDSGTGWPSFTDVLASSAVTTRPDHSYGIERTEVLCRRCGAHLGHVFDDGPEPTGLRYCINSVALRLLRCPG